MQRKITTSLLTSLTLFAITLSVHADEAKPKAVANPNADPAAYKLLKAAYDARQVLTMDFAGYDAKVVYSEGNVTKNGVLHFRTDGTSTLEFEGLSDDDYKWLKHQVLSISNHRRQGNFDEAEGKFPMAFGAGPDTGFGKLIERNDEQKLSTRVKDGKILELTRTDGDKRFIISVLDTMECDPGKYIPTRYLVSYVNPTTGELLKVDMIENRYVKVKGLWMPSGRTMVSAPENSGKGLRVRVFDFKDIKIIKS